ncbi:MAG: ElyC/SanA/YdcF family protein [Verrucomicrobiota bacterium]|nr:ElyC/SanA/YdcF family protein [Verrucomicrobiota bacterium]
MFLLKKIITQFIYPVPFLFLLFIPGYIFIYRKTPHLRRARLFFTLAGFWLLILAYGWFPRFLMASLENQYQPLLHDNQVEIEKLRNVKWIVVMGGGHSSDPRLPATSQLSMESMGRVSEAIRLHRLLPHTRILMSGSGVYDPQSNALTMSRAAQSLGVAANNIELQETSMDTAEESVALAKIIGKDDAIVVTSASHMRRSLGHLRAQGVLGIPAPAVYYTKKNTTDWNVTSLFPGLVGFVLMERYVHEVVGYWWGKSQGTIK